ncbi:hypothetical protein Pla8534_35930 [Lignipirellula cremea]|uniref:Uncharacterized protein n=2 Tax=Lignipirellula cremea TaxID=2528010 RepID=A0A518DVB3_9BACT|nr:hypothetical protein Pla8534_35930 [Lignipirellula cremea]
MTMRERLNVLAEYAFVIGLVIAPLFCFIIIPARLSDPSSQSDGYSRTDYGWPCVSNTQFSVWSNRSYAMDIPYRCEVHLTGYVVNTLILIMTGAIAGIFVYWKRNIRRFRIREILLVQATICAALALTINAGFRQRLLPVEWDTIVTLENKKPGCVEEMIFADYWGDGK